MTKELHAVIVRMNMCSCGEPERWLRVVRAGLEYLDRPVLDQAWEEHFENAINPRLQTDEGWFVFYALDSWGLTEHGCCIPGWLTDEGRELLMLLREIDCDGGKWEDLLAKANEEFVSGSIN